jgi:hypothetical protein
MLECSNFNGCLEAHVQSRRTSRGDALFRGNAYLIGRPITCSCHTPHEHEHEHEHAPNHVKHCSSPARSLMEWHVLAGIRGYRRVRSINHVQTCYHSISVNTRQPLSPSPRRLATSPTSESAAPRPQAFTGAQRVFRTHASYTPCCYQDPQRTRRLSYTIVAPPESHPACANLLPSLSDRYPGVACSEARSEPVSNCPSTYPRDPCPPPQPNLPLANSIYSL